MKKIWISILCLLLATSFIFLTKNYLQLRKEKRILQIESVLRLEQDIGAPTYIYSSQGYFGRNIICEKDFEMGATLRVYVIQNMPPRFLVIRVDPDGDRITKSQIEKS